MAELVTYHASDTAELISRIAVDCGKDLLRQHYERFHQPRRLDGANE